MQCNPYHCCEVVLDIERAFPEDTIPKHQPDSTGLIEGRIVQPISVIIIELIQTIQ